MSVPTVTHVICPACSAALDVEDHFCRRCGMPTSLRHASGGPLASEKSALRDPLDSPWVVLGLLLCVLGPFALPLLYRSRAFGLPMKMVLTALVCGIAAFAVWITLYLIGQIAAPVQELWQETYLLP
jgi:hypothetical protein